MSGPESGTTSGRGLGGEVRGFALLAASNILGQALGLFALALVTRRIGPAALGNYNFAATMVTFLGLLMNGIGYVGVRDAAQELSERLKVISETLTLQVAVGIVCYVALSAAFSRFAPDAQARTLVPVVGVSLLVTAATLDWILFLAQRRAAVAGARLLGQVCYAALVPILVTATSGPLPYAWLNVLGLGVTAALIAVAVVRDAPIRYLRPSIRALKLRFRRSLTLSYSLAMISIYNVADVLVLGYLTDAHDVGLYTAANRLPASVIALANLWLQAVFPRAATRLRANAQAFRRDLSAALSGAIVIALAITAGAAVTASRLMPALFGIAFRDAATPFALLAAAMSLVLVEAVLSNVLIAGGKDKAYAIVVTTAAGANLALNFLLVPSLQATGSAIATLVTESLLVALTLVFGKAVVGTPPISWARVCRGAAAAAMMCGAIEIMAGLTSILVAIAAGLAAFSLAAVLTRPFDPHLWRRHAPDVDD